MSLDSDITPSKCGLAMAPCGVKLGENNQPTTHKTQESNEWADLQQTKRFFRGILTNGSKSWSRLSGNTNSESSGVNKPRWFINSLGGPINSIVAYLG